MAEIDAIRLPAPSIVVLVHGTVYEFELPLLSVRGAKTFSAWGYAAWMHMRPGTRRMPGRVYMGHHRPILDSYCTFALYWLSSFLVATANSVVQHFSSLVTS